MADRRSQGRGLLLAAAAIVAAGAVVAFLAGAFDDDGRTAGPAPPVPAASAQDGARLNDIYDRAAPSVVFIQARIAGRRQSPFGPRSLSRAWRPAPGS